jgi:hypothetical protein
MPYEILATSKTPALIIYLLDVSGSMSEKLGNKRRIDVVMDALGAMLRQMVFRSTKGSRVAARYRIAMYAYSDHVYDLLNGVKGVDQVAQLGIPELSPMRSTDTAGGFAQVEKLLAREMPGLANCPAPLVCHMTDGEYTGADPEPIVRRIMSLSVPDGNVLVENIFISDNILSEQINDPSQWNGVLPNTKLRSDYARKLRAMSSPLPDGYRVMMRESGYNIAENAAMMIPGMTPALVEMGFVMSMSTPIGQERNYDR